MCPWKLDKKNDLLLKRWSLRVCSVSLGVKICHKKTKLLQLIDGSLHYLYLWCMISARNTSYKCFSPLTWELSWIMQHHPLVETNHSDHTHTDLACRNNKSATPNVCNHTLLSTGPLSTCPLSTWSAMWSSRSVPFPLWGTPMCTCKLSGADSLVFEQADSELWDLEWATFLFLFLFPEGHSYFTRRSEQPARRLTEHFLFTLFQHSITSYLPCLCRRYPG